MNEIKVSIIVPIYNVDKYLRQCLESLINQSLEEIEIICVNDGSTDNSLQIVQEYANKDNRIKVIDKENAGYGHTMNRGLDIAQGEYIGIVESDDFVKSNMFEVLFNTAKQNKVDIVKSSFLFFWGEKSIIQPAELLKYSEYYKVVNPIEEQGVFWLPPAIWSAIYKRELIENHKIRFLETPGASYQDTSFNFKVLASARRVYLIPDAFLYYRQDNMTASVKNKGKVYCVNDEYEEIEKFLSRNPNIQKNLNPLKNRLKFATYMWNLDRIDKSFKKDFIAKISDEFKKALREQSIDKALFTLTEWQRLKLIAENSFYGKIKFLFEKLLVKNDGSIKVLGIKIDYSEFTRFVKRGLY